MKSWWRNLCCGIISCGVFVVESSLLNRCCGVCAVSVVEYLLWNLCCGIFVVV